jgi:hypothetical protein
MKGRNGADVSVGRATDILSSWGGSRTGVGGEAGLLSYVMWSQIASVEVGKAGSEIS